MLEINEEIKDKKVWAPRWLLWLVLAGLVLVVAGMIILIVINYKNDKRKNADNLSGGENQIEQEVKRKGILSLQVEEKEYKVGDEILVKILMDTKNSDMVLAEATVIYEDDFLELIKTEEENSVLPMSIMKQERSGKINIIRGAPGDADENDYDDGYNGADGILAELIFRIKKAGETEIKFEAKESSLILDDAKGTEMEVEYGKLKLGSKE